MVHLYSAFNPRHFTEIALHLPIHTHIHTPMAERTNARHQPAQRSVVYREDIWYREKNGGDQIWSPGLGIPV